MYQKGEKLVYGGTGVCTVMDFQEMPFPGTTEKKKYYVLQPQDGGCTIYAPVEDGKVFMRPVITGEEANELIDAIPSLNAEAYHNRSMQQLSEHYLESFRSHSCGDLIELTMSIYAKRRVAEEQKRKFGQMDEKYMKRAEALLYGEFSEALGIPVEEVSTYIAERVKALTDEAEADEEAAQ